MPHTWILLIEPDPLFYRLLTRWHTLQGEGERLDVASALFKEGSSWQWEDVLDRLAECEPGRCVVLVHARWVSPDVLEALRDQMEAWGEVIKLVLMCDEPRRKQEHWPELLDWLTHHSRTHVEVTWVKMPFTLASLREAMTF